MNPSSPGWIAKQLQLLENMQPFEANYQHYDALLKTGFIYGFSTNLSIPQPHFIHQWTVEENTKVNLFDALAITYKAHFGNLENFSQYAVAFYDKLLNGGEFIRSNNIDQKKANQSLEKIIHTRIKTNDSLIKKNFSGGFSNALLYLDVLAFEQYCTAPATPRIYASNLEFLIFQVIYLALNHKSKSAYDELLLDLFEKSLRYHKNNWDQALDLRYIPFAQLTTINEKRYILELSSLIFWNDPLYPEQQDHFMYRLADSLNLSKDHLRQAQQDLKFFIEKNGASIPFFNQSHPLKNFYDQTGAMVSTIILRNKKRLLKEIMGSRDLVLLLGKSTYRDLSREERKRVKTQLLDVCKSIPSLAIFLLPGGSVLLPLLIHYIPELLPSAFDENRIENPSEES